MKYLMETYCEATFRTVPWAPHDTPLCGCSCFTHGIQACQSL
jgi:hypothetical protein